MEAIGKNPGKTSAGEEHRLSPNIVDFLCFT